MSLQAQLAKRADANKPVRVGLIGAGKFGSMFLAQVPTIRGLEVAVIADLDPERAKRGVPRPSAGIPHVSRARASPRDGRDACNDERVEVVIEATGNPVAGIAHALEAIAARKHIVMVNVEADTLAGAYARARGARRRA